MYEFDACINCIVLKIKVGGGHCYFHCDTAAKLGIATLSPRAAAWIWEFHDMPFPLILYQSYLHLIVNGKLKSWQISCKNIFGSNSFLFKDMIFVTITVATFLA